MTWWKIGLVTLAWTIVWAAPAVADHLTLTPEARPGARPERQELAPPSPAKLPAEISPEGRAPEGRAPEGAAPSPDVRLDMKLGTDGFRLGGAVSGELGTYGAWVNGRRVGRGIVVDGEVQTKTGTRSYSFSLDGDLLEGMAWTIARKWLLGF